MPLRAAHRLGETNLTTDDTGHGPFGRAAQIYREAGWLGTLPIGRAPGQKSPPPGGWTGHGSPYPSGGDVAAWLETHGAFNIGLRVPDGVIGLDVDAYVKDGIAKTGDATLAELEARLGPLPPTWVSSARPAPSGIRWYRVPPGRNWPGEAGKFIEIIQQGHRYAVVWPSTNPEADGARYGWWHEQLPGHVIELDGPPRVEQLAELPAAWVEGLTLAYEVASKADIGGGAQAQWVAELRHGSAPCRPVSATLDKALASLRTDAGSRHETARDALSALVRLGGEGHGGAYEAVVALGDAFRRAVGEERWKSGEWDRLVVGAVKLAAAANPHPRQHCEHDPATSAGLVVPEGFSAPAAGTASAPEVDIAAGALTLPDAFWQARESLGRIRQAAHSRVRSADVVLAGVLTRLAASVPHTLRADTGIGTPACLNLFAAIVGPSGAGKSSGLSVSRQIIKTDRYLEEFPLGSGEGLAEAYMGEADEPSGVMARDGSEKMKRVRKQVRHNALFHSDEGGGLNKLIERAGSTVGETLRTAWSGETVGQKNGRAETTRTVPAGSYSAGLMIGYQPATALPLLADHEAGTPQRFIYVWAIDPTIPDRGARTPWPGEIVSPFPPDVPTDAPPPGMIISAPQLPNRDPITFAAAILDELYDLEHAKATGTLPADHPLRDPFRSQHTMLKIKVSALLALLEARRQVNLDDWQLAQIILDTSDAVRIYLQALAAAAAGKARAAVLAAEAESETYRAQARAGVEAALGATAERRVAVRLAETFHALGGDPVALPALRRKIAARDRMLVEPAVELAVGAGWLALPGDGLVHAGVSRPVVGT